MSTPDPSAGGRTRHPRAPQPVGSDSASLGTTVRQAARPLGRVLGVRAGGISARVECPWRARLGVPSGLLPPARGVLEMTTADQRLVTRKNRKVRRMRALYPEVPVHVVYQRDFHSLLASHGLLPPAAGAA